MQTTLSLRYLKLHEQYGQIKNHQGVTQKMPKASKYQSVENFKSSIVKSLFDICSCKCNDLVNCLCPARNKVPPLEHEFLHDQRTFRL